MWPFVRMLIATGVTHYVYNECAFIALSVTLTLTLTPTLTLTL